MDNIVTTRTGKSIHIIAATLHVVMLVLSIFLLISISLATFNDRVYYGQPGFVHHQLVICCVFLADFFFEWFTSPRKWHYLATKFPLLLVSIPYLWIIHLAGWKFSYEIQYMLQFIPLVRGGYALAIVVGWFAYNKAAGLFITYLVTLLATIYFASLVFYIYEHTVNTGVGNYTDALWWAMMDVTTVGCNIEAVTPVGRILSVLLAALGMMMFPIFTVYITSLITNGRRSVATILSQPYKRGGHNSTQDPTAPQ